VSAEVVVKTQKAKNVQTVMELVKKNVMNVMVKVLETVQNVMATLP
jgi:hypothetical protein